MNCAVGQTGDREGVQVIDVASKQGMSVSNKKQNNGMQKARKL